MEQILLCLSFALIFGLLMSRVAKKVGLPAVTAYLITGLLIGPYIIGAIGISGIGFNTLEQVESFGIVSQVALGFIAFTIGNEFRLSDLKSMGVEAIVVGICESTVACIVVDAIMIVLHFFFPTLITLPIAITFGAIAAATAPAATLMVVRQYKAHGPLTKLLLMVVALDDAVGLILFAISFGIAQAIQSGGINVLSIVVEPLVEIIISVLLGVIAGACLNYLERLFHSRSKRTALAVGFVLLTTGIAMSEFDVGPVHCSFSLLLVCMFTGTIFCNMSDASEELMSRIERWTAPLNILFFILSGAELNLTILSNPLVLGLGIVYIIFRCIGKYSGAYIGSTVTGCDKKIRNNLGITLFPQAGVALGMSASAMALTGGDVVRSVILFSVLVYELVGPTLTKRSLITAGEINPDLMVSNRIQNIEKEGFTITSEKKQSK